MKAAHADVGVAADYLLAFVRGQDADDEDAPYIGACLVAEFLHIVRCTLVKQNGGTDG
jgi:hypothetical protein